MEIGYFNARVRGLRASLFGAADYEAFLKAASEADYRELLKSTPYGRHIAIAEARPGRAGDVIASAVKSNAVDTFKFLWETAPVYLRAHMKTLYSAWEVFNLKAIIRGFAKDVRREEIRSVLVPAGEFDDAALNVLLGAKDLADVARILETWGSPYAAALRDVSFAGRVNSFEIEMKLDLFACGRLLNALKGRSADNGIISGMLSLRIDAQNIMTLLKTAGGEFSKEAIEGFFIEGGSLVNRRMFAQSAGTENAQDILDALAKGVRDKGFKDILSAADAPGAAAMEEAMDAAQEARLRKAAVTDPFTIALGAAFVYMKVREIKNLRLIAKAKLLGIPPDELKGLLIYRQ